MHWRRRDGMISSEADSGLVMMSRAYLRANGLRAARRVNRAHRAKRSRSGQDK